MITAETQPRCFGHVDQIDNYLRREDTKIAQILYGICPCRGEAYINSNDKRAFDLLIGIPSSIIATPTIITLATAKMIEDGKNPLFVHKRASKIDDSSSDDLPLWKVRCMKPHSDKGTRGNTKIANGLKPENDPRNTKFGSFMRKYQLEELPQLYQVLLGQMSLIGIRAIPQDGAQEQKEVWSLEKYKKWVIAYNSGRPGLSGLFQSFGSTVKGDQDNYHLDMFYFKNAWLGLDMYLVWRTALRLTKIK